MLYLIPHDTKHGEMEERKQQQLRHIKRGRRGDLVVFRRFDSFTHITLMQINSVELN